ncbi:hypothetical protein Tco_0585445 [Tanacetum coccineum]
MDDDMKCRPTDYCTARWKDGRRSGRGGGRTGEPTSKVYGRTGDQDGQGGPQPRGGRAAVGHDLGGTLRLVPHLVTPENKRIERYIYGLASQIRAMVAATEPTTIQSVVLKARMLTDEAIKNGSLKDEY